MFERTNRIIDDIWVILLNSRRTSGQAEQQRRTQGCCFDCGRCYGDEYGFPDLIVDNEIWAVIAPMADGGGLLCPCCMCRRMHLAGITATVEFKSGPFCPAAGEQA